MELFIQVDENGNVVNHPIMGSNFREAFPHIDTNNLPSNFARFERVPPPVPSPYEKNHRVNYQKRPDGVWTDVHTCDLMTREEITALQDQVKANFAAIVGFSSWTFNEFTCRFDPPVPYPNDGKKYRWDEPTTNWIEITL
jgi:hypothetical protein